MLDLSADNVRSYVRLLLLVLQVKITCILDEDRLHWILTLAHLINTSPSQLLVLIPEQHLALLPRLSPLGRLINATVNIIIVSDTDTCAWGLLT